MSLTQARSNVLRLIAGGKIRTWVAGDAQSSRNLPRGKSSAALPPPTTPASQVSCVIARFVESEFNVGERRGWRARSASRSCIARHGPQGHALGADERVYSDSPERPAAQRITDMVVCKRGRVVRPLCGLNA